MKILLDTCTFLWILIDAPRLSETARSLFLNEDNECYLSSVSAWEIALKHALGKLPLPGRPDRYIPEQRQRHGISPLPLDELAALQWPGLPNLHADSFDRMLICQAIAGGLTILTPDEQISAYPIMTAW